MVLYEYIKLFVNQIVFKQYLNNICLFDVKIILFLKHFSLFFKNCILLSNINIWKTMYNI